jgi:L-threonylcarbamoyladenylate synthase
MSYLTDRLDERVAELLQKGAVGFMPSDTIYGLSCQALDEQAVERVYRLKKRDLDKPFIILISNISQLWRLNIDTAQTLIMESYWPGPISLECDVSQAPVWLNRGKRCEAFRMPADENLKKLIEETGPIVSTSANLQGGEPAATVAEAKEYFGEQLDFYVDVGDLSDRQPSTLVRNSNGKLEVIRPGAVEIKE